MRKRETEIGEIVSVNGSIVTVQLSDDVKSNMPVIDGIVYRIGQVGSFVKIPLGYVNLFGIVNQVGAAAIPQQFQDGSKINFVDINNKQWINIVLVGEQY